VEKYVSCLPQTEENHEHLLGLPASGTELEDVTSWQEALEGSIQFCTVVLVGLVNGELMSKVFRWLAD